MDIVNLPLISVVIPVYKAENCLPELYRRLKSAIETITLNFEIILIEDCGGDGSWGEIVKLHEKDSRVKGLQFSRNFGQHYAITAGLDYCNGDWIVVMDCDLQDRPEEISRLYNKAMEGYDVVLANRGKRVDSLPKRFTSWLFYKIFNWLSGMNYNSQVANFCMISRKVVSHYRLMREQSRFFGGHLCWMGFPTANIDVRHDKRFAGKSTYTLKKLLGLASDTIIAYSDKPLRLSIKFGFMISSLAFAYGLYILFHTIFYGVPVTGWSSLIVSIYFVGGIIIANLGIIGVYLGKAFDETKKRPLYVIAKSTDDTWMVPSLCA